jgi:hypothetical protein
VCVWGGDGMRTGVHDRVIAAVFNLAGVYGCVAW